MHVLRRHRRPSRALHRGLLPNPRQAPTRRGPPADSAARRHRRGHLRRVAALAAGGARAPVHGHGPPGADPRWQGAPAGRRPGPRAGGAPDPGGLLGQASGAQGGAHIPGVGAREEGDDGVSDVHQRAQLGHESRVRGIQPVCVQPRQPPGELVRAGRRRAVRGTRHAVDAAVRSVPRPVRVVVRRLQERGHHLRLCGSGDAGQGDSQRLQDGDEQDGAGAPAAHDRGRHIVQCARGLSPDAAVFGCPRAASRRPGARRSRRDGQTQARSGGQGCGGR